VSKVENVDFRIIIDDESVIIFFGNDLFVDRALEVAITAYLFFDNQKIKRNIFLMELARRFEREFKRLKELRKVFEKTEEFVDGE